MFAAGLSCLSAEMNPRKRYIEMKWGFDVYAGQNAMNLTDIFQKELVLDFPQIYRNIGNGPLSIDVGLNTTAYDFSVDFRNFRCLSAQSVVCFSLACGPG